MRRTTDRRGAIYLLDIMFTLIVASLLAIAAMTLAEQGRKLDRLAAAKLSISSAAEYVARAVLQSPQLAKDVHAARDLSLQLEALGFDSTEVELTSHPAGAHAVAVKVALRRPGPEGLMTGQMEVIVHAE